MTTAATECFAIVTDWRRQFGTALPTAVPQILVLGDLQVGLRSGGRFCKGPIQHDAFLVVFRAAKRGIGDRQKRRPPRGGRLRLGAGLSPPTFLEFSLNARFDRLDCNSAHRTVEK